MSTYDVVEVKESDVTQKVESFRSYKEACRARWIFVAHERKNGRDTVYKVFPSGNEDGSDFEIYDLPDWALTQLRKSKEEGSL